jgi:hypothetical protein
MSMGKNTSVVRIGERVGFNCKVVPGQDKDLSHQRFDFAHCAPDVSDTDRLVRKDDDYIRLGCVDASRKQLEVSRNDLQELRLRDTTVKGGTHVLAA